MNNHLQHHHLVLPKISRHQPCTQTQWIFHNFPTDITLEVCGVTFALHKFLLISKSGRIRKLVSENRDSDPPKMELLNLPGGAESFELASKFCYGINFDITPANIVQLFCVSDYLEMHEGNNLSSIAEHYMDTIVCNSLKMCVEVLTKCESLLPLADELRIVNRCVDSIASKACVEKIASSFNRLEYSNSGQLYMGNGEKCEGDWWIKDLSSLRIDLYQRVLEAMKCRGVRPGSISASLVSYYAHNNQSRSSSIVIETIISLLPVERLVVPINFLFVLLQSSIVLDCSIACRLSLERRISSQLDMATIDDLSINGGDTVFDVDTVHRILMNFLQQDDSEEDESVFETEGPHSPSQMALYKVSKLVDNYLAQIATNTNLKHSKFMVIAESLPAYARTVHDGLYRAIDVYLKAHQGLLEPEKRRLCKLIDFQKLSQEAGEHAAQNERLPLQSVVQVLYAEQLRLRDALFCSYPEEEPKSIFQSWRVKGFMSPKDNYESLRRENKELKLELARLRMRMNDLEKDHVSIKMRMEKTSSCKFMCSFTKKISFFRHSYSWGLSSSKLSQRIDSKVTDRTF